MTPVSLLPPAAIALSFGLDFAATSGLVLASASPRLELAKAAAKNGFKGLNCLLLKKLLRHWGMPQSEGKQPATELNMCRRLIRAALPDASESDVRDALAKRGRDVEAWLDSVLQKHEDLEGLKEVFFLKTTMRSSGNR